MGFTDIRLEHYKNIYTKAYNSINELKNEEDNEELYRLFFINVIINRIINTKLAKASSKKDLKQITNYMKLETMVIKDKIEAYKSGNYELETEDEMRDILETYFEVEPVEKIMANISKAKQKIK